MNWDSHPKTLGYFYKNFKKHNIMKTLILMTLLSIFVSKSVAQDIATGKTKHSFVEWNFGAAYLSNEDSVFPGTSVLWGKTYINENNFIIEYEAGFALPSLVTAKVGIGKQFHNTKVIMGVRPFPFHLFMQSSFTNGKKGYWITSIEFNPLDSDLGLSFGSSAILNFGYRWTLNK